MALLNRGSKASIAYHSIFNFPLARAELKKWEIGPKGLGEITNYKLQITNRQNLKTRKIREKISHQKLKIARRAAKLLGKIPTVKMMAVTGALAMKNATAESDIDLMIITKANTLWLTRFFVYLLLRIKNYDIRKPKQKTQKNKLCLNIWIDETALEWEKKDRNIYTAHEIAQIMPLVNKDRTYKRFLRANKWILDYWPKAVRMNNELRIMNYAKNPLYVILNSLFALVNKVAFKMQYLYMKPKITREVVTPHKALFHPRNWGKIVLDRLKVCL